MKPFSQLFIATLLFLISSQSLDAQVLVYKIDYNQSKGINYHPFEGGYFIAPVLGGAGSFLLTSTDGPHTFTVSSNGGKLFTAVTGGGDKKAVMAATTGSGTATGSMVAAGDINHTLSITSPTQTLTVRVAKKLTGTAISSDDESKVTAPAIDGSIGSAGTSEIHLTLDEDQTNLANHHALSISQTVDQIKLLLGQTGFVDLASTTATAPTTGTTTGTTTGSTSSGG